MNIRSTLPLLLAAFVLPLCGQDSPPAAPAAQPPPLTAPEPVPGAIDPKPASDAFFPRLGHDAWDLYALPANATGRQWRNFGFSLLAVAAVGSDDQGLRAHQRSASDDHLAKRIRPLGTWIPFAAMGITWGIGHLSHNPEVTAMGEDGVEAGLLAMAVVLPGKYLFGRARPSHGLGAGSFKPFRGGSSFPSGEATLAFTTATVISQHSDSWWVKGSVYTLAAAVGWSRRQLDAHWSSDIVAGALLGIGIGRWTVHRHRPGTLDGKVSWEIAPAFGDDGGRGLVLSAHW